MVVMNNNNDNDNNNIQQEHQQQLQGPVQRPPRVVAAEAEVEVEAAVVAAPQEPQLRNLIQDLDGWLESNGLRSVDDINRSNNNNNHNDSTNNNTNHVDTLYISDERQRIKNENLYIQSIYHEIFYNDTIQQQKEYNDKLYNIQQLQNMKMDIITSKSNISNDDNPNENENDNDNNIIRNIPLDRMAYICDTIYIMIQNKQWRQQYNYTWFDNNDNDTNMQQQSNMKTTTTTSSQKNYQLSLTSFSKESVQAFIDVILYETKNHNQDDNQNNNTRTTTTNTPNNNNQDTGNTTGNNTEQKIPTVSLSTSSLISESTLSSIRTALYNIQNDIVLFDICRIAHYLMAQCIVDCIIEIFIVSVDIYNCFSIYQFVEDELHLSSTTLIEKCLSYMIDTISTYMENNNENDTTTNHNNNNDNDSNNNSSNNDITDICDIQLKERLIIMKRAMESSIHGYNSINNKNKNSSSNNKNQMNHHPSNSSDSSSTDKSTEQQEQEQYTKKRIYFTSLEEYLSIFAERVQYYQERLQEAKEQQQQLLIQEQQQYNRMMNEYGSFSKRGIIPSKTKSIITSSLYNDTQKKILKQEQRLRTLEIAYAEQKALFRNHINHQNNNEK